MKIKDMIKELQKYDENLTVVVYGGCEEYGQAGKQELVRKQDRLDGFHEDWLPDEYVKIDEALEE